MLRSATSVAQAATGGVHTLENCAEDSSAVAGETVAGKDRAHRDCARALFFALKQRKWQREGLYKCLAASPLLSAAQEVQKRLDKHR